MARGSKFRNKRNYTKYVVKTKALIKTTLLEKCFGQMIINLSKECWFGYAKTGVGYENNDFLFFFIHYFSKRYFVRSSKLIYLIMHIYRFQNPVHHLKICAPLILVIGKIHILFIELLYFKLASIISFKIKLFYEK